MNIATSTTNKIIHSHMPLSYNEVRKLILQTLDERPQGTKVEVPNQQNYELALLDYVQQLETAMSTSIVGIADAETEPIEPPSARVAYLSQVGVDQTVIYRKFVDAQLNPITVTTDETHVGFVVLFWNTNYWQVQTVMIPAYSAGGEVEVGAVRFDIAQELKTNEQQQARENINAASQDSVDELANVVYTQYTDLTCQTVPDIFEENVETEVTLAWETKFNDQPVTPDSIEVRKDEAVLVTDPDVKSVTDNITTTQEYEITAVIKGIVKAVTVTVNAYRRMYFDASPKASVESADVLGMYQQPIKPSPAGEVTVDVGANEYLWLCVPDDMTINNVTSSGFDVPMALPIIVTVEGKGNYKCYRSAGPWAAGRFNGIIE